MNLMSILFKTKHETAPLAQYNASNRMLILRWISPTGATTMKKSHTIAIVITAVLILTIYTQITIFVVPPIGALPEGKTVIITRLNKTEFIDSPDGMCDRIQGGVSLLCRGMIIGAVIEKSTILLRLPYNSWLYSISIGGKEYDH